MKNIVALFIFLVSHTLIAQQDAWIYFEDKPNAAYYLNNPLEMLSQQALNRRANHNIALDLFDVPIHQDYVNQILAQVPVLSTSKWLNAVHVRASESQINGLTSLPFVQSIEFADKSLNESASKNHQNNQIFPSNLPQIDFPYGTSANQITMLNGQVLHQQNFTGSGKIIAVMDAGFPFVNTAPPFQRLRDNNLILGGYNFVDGNDNYYTRNNHGSLVLSTMGGYLENNLVGTAPDASYYLFITEDIANENPLEESFWVEAAEVADSLGVDIINTSLGYVKFDNPAYDHTYADLDGNTTFISRGANIAFTRGMVVVVSAGNSGATSNPYISAPADAANVLSVGAVDSDGNYAVFSSIGPTADGRIKPDVVAQGQQAVLAFTENSTFTASGTSFSGPIIAGMVASLWHALPTKTNSEIVQLIKNSAHLFATPNMQYGYGIPNFSQALNVGLSTSEFTRQKMKVYPNPSQGLLAFSYSGNCTSVKLYNVMGSLMLHQVTCPDQNINIADLSSGIYFYEIVLENQVYKGKIIKS